MALPYFTINQKQKSLNDHWHKHTNRCFSVACYTRTKTAPIFITKIAVS